VTAPARGPGDAAAGPDAPRKGHVDLDRHEPPPPPRRRRHPYRTALLVAAVAGAGLGGAAQGATRQDPPVRARLVATLQLRGVALADRPTAVLELRVQNLGTTPRTVVDVDVRGRGLVPTTAPVDRTAWPGAPAVVPLEVPLDCRRGPAPAGGAASAALRLAPPPDDVPVTGQDTVAALPIGVAAAPEGVCVAADARLPLGWSEPVRATAWSFPTPRALRVTVVDLPADVTAVLGADADGALALVRGAPVPVRAGRATLDVDLSPLACREGGGRGVVPTGMGLLVDGGRGTRYARLPLGLDLAGRLLPLLGNTCPDGPTGPSAVRPDFPG
jgi:hypothetical protein